MSTKSKIVKFPSEQLLKPTAFLAKTTEEWSRVGGYSEALLRTLESYPGAAAVAANQIPKLLDIIPRMFVQNVTGKLPRVIVNPAWGAKEILSVTKIQKEIEGCLSFPGVKIPVPRYIDIVARFDDEWSIEQNVELSGFEARMFQHECEHLEGKTFIDNISEKEAFKIKTIMRKAKGGF